jgi:hypothetical protein
MLDGASYFELGHVVELIAHRQKIKKLTHVSVRFQHQARPNPALSLSSKKMALPSGGLLLQGISGTSPLGSITGRRKIK